MMDRFISSRIPEDNVLTNSSIVCIEEFDSNAILCLTSTTTIIFSKGENITPLC